MYKRQDHNRAVDELAAIGDLDQMACLLALVCGLGGVALGWVAAACTAPWRLAKGLFSDPVRAVLAVTGAMLGVYLAMDAFEVRQVAPEGVNHSLQWAAFLVGAVALVGALAPFLDVARLRRGGFAGWRAARGRDAWLAAWLLGFALTAVFAVPFGATRYALPAMPPLFLMAALFAARFLPPRVPWIAAGLTAVLGLACAIADYRAAGVYREVAEKAVERMAAGGPWESGRTWIWGELGFRWYLEHKAGLEVIPTRSNAPQTGDRVLKSAVCTASDNDGSSGTYRLHPELVKRLKGGAVEDYEDGFPVRIHNAYATALFYGAPGRARGFLPYAFSTAFHDRIQTWEVQGENPFFAGFEQAQKESAPPLRVGENVVRPELDVRLFMVDPEVEMLRSIIMVLPGRITWEGVPVPPDSMLELRVGEHSRLYEFSEPGPGSLLRVLVNGEPVAEKALDTRRDPAQRVWHPLRVDLARWGGQQVAISFQALPQPLPEGADPTFAQYVNVGFGEPRIVARR